MIKRTFDLFVSTIVLVLLAPFFLIIPILIKKGSEGPVFYRGERVGRYCKLFRIFKFRTMVSNAEKIGGCSTSDDDPRITAIGKALRKYKLDEFPQFINVFLGQMSLVGPRPNMLEYSEKLDGEDRKILELTPGLTDWATIWNADEGSALAGCPNPDDAYDQIILPTKTRLQLKYYMEHSIWVDLKILAFTAIKIFWPDWTPAELAGFDNPCKLKQSYYCDLVTTQNLETK